MPPRLPHHIPKPPLPQTQTLSSFSTSSRTPASPFFALAALSNSRETQHFNKLTRLPRAEHSPPLKLIQTSEVDPHPLPNRPSVAKRIPYSFRPKKQESLLNTTTPATPDPIPATPTSKSITRVNSDTHSLALGRALLAAHRLRTSHLKRNITRSLRLAQRRSTALTHLRTEQAKERLEWEKERDRLRREAEVEGGKVVGLILVLTGVGVWWAWPEGREGGGGRAFAGRGEEGLGGMKDVRRADETLLVPKTDEVRKTNGVVSMTPATEVGVGKGEVAGGTWWRGLFWKQ